jgi:hypothetical protein
MRQPVLAMEVICSSRLTALGQSRCSTRLPLVMAALETLSIPTRLPPILILLPSKRRFTVRLWTLDPS